jgi:hypothetical protein
LRSVDLEIIRCFGFHFFIGMVLNLSRARRIKPRDLLVQSGGQQSGGESSAEARSTEAMADPNRGNPMQFPADFTFAEPVFLLVVHTFHSIRL